MPLSQPRHRTWVAVAVALALTAATVLASPGSASAAPPPNPSDSQLTSAQQQKDALAAQVGQLAAQTAQMQTRLNQLTGEMELAEQKVALALSKLTDAKAAAVTARHNVQLAQQKVDAAQRDFVGYVQATYMSGSLDGTTGMLLTATDPSSLLQQSALSDYQATHELNAIGDMQRATVGKSNADATARRAVQAQQSAADAAKNAEQDAVAAVQSAQAEQQQLQTALSANQTKLQSAQSQLATLTNQRAAYNAYQAEQARIRAAAAAAAAERAREAAAAQQQNGGGGGASSGPSGPYVPPGGGGSWTAQKGRAAVSRAERWLGTPYSWAGGNANGPTLGVCAGDGAFNDCNVVGFDCSGLVMYAWAQFPFAHYAATQYLQGSYHPSEGNLMPGDLAFWSSDGTVAGIHHVAIYIGGGMVIQAPESGELIQETPLNDVSWGLFGFTRPLT
ncbi:MAG TPA: NlpC/P60 family protein [Jatrophihabitantaceae bacterium]